MKKRAFAFGVVLTVLLLAQLPSSTPQVQARTCYSCCTKGFNHVLPGYYYTAWTQGRQDCVHSNERCLRVGVRIWYFAVPLAFDEDWSGFAATTYWDSNAQWGAYGMYTSHWGFTNITGIYRETAVCWIEPY